jgi:hypothetical protein
MNAPPVDPNWTLEWLKIAQGLFGTLLGGALVLLGSWLSDRRKERTELIASDQRETALLTGLFAIRNFVIERLNEYEAEGGGLLSQLQPLRTAQVYLHRLIDRAPSESESLMIVVIELGLKLDSLIATMDRRDSDPGLRSPRSFAKAISHDVEELLQSWEQFDLVSMSHLSFLSDEDLAKFMPTPNAEATGSGRDD